MSKTDEVYNVPRGTAYLTTQQIITYTTYLIFYVALARVLDPIEVNEIGLLLAAQAAFVALTQLGLPASATRYISSNIARNRVRLVRRRSRLRAASRNAACAHVISARSRASAT